MQNQVNTSVNAEFRRNNRPINAKNLDDIASIFNYLLMQKTPRFKFSEPFSSNDKRGIDPMLPPEAYLAKPANFVTSKLVWSAVCKTKSPIFAGRWLRDGVHLVTGSSSGDMTLWNPLTYTQELSFAGHESAIRAICVSHDGDWVLSADHNGQIKYWQPNLNMVNSLAAHSDPIRDMCFSPTDAKFASCSDDGLIKIWDFERSQSDCTMQGHGTDVKCLDWHPYKGLILSGSKDCQQPIMLWDPRTASAFCTIHTHKNAIMSIKWNNSGNLFASASKDKTIKIFDIRSMSEIQAFKGHQKEVYNVCWHTISDNFLASGGVDGSLFYWILGDEKEAGSIESAHDGVIWEVAWHPHGHILASVSNDQTCKIWLRSQPGNKTEMKNRMSIFPTTIGEDDPIISENENTTLIEQMFYPKNPRSIPGLKSSVSEKYIPAPIPSPIEKQQTDPVVTEYFTCSFPKSYHTKSYRKDRYPIGKCAKPVIPTSLQIEEEEEYLYDENYDKNKYNEPIECIDIYEEDEETMPAQFTNSSKNLNLIDEESRMDILDVIRSYKNYRSDYQRSDEGHLRRDRSRNTRPLDDYHRG